MVKASLSWYCHKVIISPTVRRILSQNRCPAVRPPASTWVRSRAAHPSIPTTPVLPITPANLPEVSYHLPFGDSSHWRIASPKTPKYQLFEASQNENNSILALALNLFRVWPSFELSHGLMDFLVSVPPCPQDLKPATTTPSYQNPTKLRFVSSVEFKFTSGE